MEPKRYAFQNAPRCTATSKRTRLQCGAPRERGSNVCRFHGARGGAPRGKRHGNYKHGNRSIEATEARALAYRVIRESKQLVEAIATEEPMIYTSTHASSSTVDAED